MAFNPTPFSGATVGKAFNFFEPKLSRLKMGLIKTTGLLDVLHKTLYMKGPDTEQTFSGCSLNLSLPFKYPVELRKAAPVVSSGLLEGWKELSGWERKSLSHRGPIFFALLLT